MALFLLLGINQTLFSSITEFSQVNQDENGNIQWQLTLPRIEDITYTASGIEFPGWNTTIGPTGVLVPVLSKLIYTTGGAPELDFDVSNTRTLPEMNMVVSSIEKAKGADITAQPMPAYTSNQVNTKYIGSSGDFELWAINVVGVLYDPSLNLWHIPNMLTISIGGAPIYSDPEASNDLLLNPLPPQYNNDVNTVQSGLGHGKFKLFLLTDGIYRIYYDSLAQIQGFPDNEQILSHTITLSNKGEQQTIYVYDGGDGVFDTGDYFDFIGTQNYYSGNTQYFDPFTDINIYWLDWGVEEGLRFIEESGALVESDPVKPTSFWDNIHVENDLLFDRLGQVDTDMPTTTRDHYFWETINSGQHKEVSFSVDDPFLGSSENVEVSIGFHGLTYSQTSGEEAEHTLFAFLNDYSIGEGNWSQQMEYTLVSPANLNLSHNILEPGNNILSIFAPVSTEPGNYDRIVLNWIQIGYEHLLTAQNNTLRFRKSRLNPAATLEYEITGFTNPDLVLYKSGLSKIVAYSIREDAGPQSTLYSLVFQDQATDNTPDYWVSTVDNLLHPAKIIADTSASLRTSDGDFIVVTIPEFLQDLDEYLEFKRLEGWNPVAVSLADIYDEFNYGITSPHAIKAFLKYANNHWVSTPRYALFIGDATANPQSAKQDIRLRNFPTFYMQTYGWGAAESDFWYSLVNGNDYLPDINLGRIPCSERSNLILTLQKLMNYGSGTNYGNWQNEITTIAGFDPIFKVQSEVLLHRVVPSDYLPSRIFIDRDSEGQIFWGDTDSLVSQWNAGKILINFLGHGGGAVWADRSLFVQDDIQYLNGDTPPAFVTSMTCFTASFSQVRGLGEVVLTQSSAGAIGWFGSTGVGWIINDYLMVQPLLRRLLEGHQPVGDLINLARIEYFLTNSAYDYLKPSMLFQYNYLGDPTTRLALPESADLLQSQKYIYTPSEQLEFSYTGSEPGTLHLLPVNGGGIPWQRNASVFNTILNQQFLFTQEDSPPNGVGRMIYTLDRGTHVAALHGSVSYSISTDWFEHRSPTAEMLAESDIIHLQTRFHSTVSTADSLIVSFSGRNHNSYRLAEVGGWWILDEPVHFSSETIPTYYSFSAFEQGRLLMNSPVFRLFLSNDISLTLNSIHEGYKDKQCGLIVEYTLNGLTQGLAVLNHEEISPGFQQSFSKNVTVREGSNSLFISTYFGSGIVSLTTSLHLGGDVDLTDNAITFSLNPTYYQVMPELGLTFDGQTPDTLSLWESGYLTGGASDTLWIRVTPFLDSLEAIPGITLYLDSMIYSVESSIPDLDISVSASRSVFLKARQLAVWQILGIKDQKYSLHNAGLLAMGEKQDFTSPNISMMIENQLFFDGDFLLKNSRLNLLAEDENGFSWRSDDIKVMVDASPVPISVGDTTESGCILSISAALELNVGEHEIVYSVSDALGNWSADLQVTGVVAGEADIIDYGNYPNPFEGETLLIFELTQPLTDLAIEIFTISGYKLHVIDDYTARISPSLGSIGYHEVPWNGRDRDNNFVANGVYFYRIKGELDGEMLVGPVSKMVKNR